MPKAEPSAHGGEAQELTIDAYDVIYAAGGMAVPAHEFGFLTAKRIPSFRSGLHVRAPHGLGFEKGALVFAGLIALVAAAHFFTKAPEAVLFWAAYVLTRPLGATLGDTLTKSHAEGGLGFSRITSSLVLAAGMVVVVALTSLRKPAPAA